MKSSASSPCIRLTLSVLLGAALLLPAGCGVETGGEQRLFQGLGGSFRPDPNAYAVTPTSDAVAATSRPTGLPPSVDLNRQGLIPPVNNQRWNNCVGWALGYYVMTGVWARALRDHGRGQFLDLTNEANWLSPHFLYSQRDTLADRALTAPDEPKCFELDEDENGNPRLGCMRPERALWLLVTKGCSKWTWIDPEERKNSSRPAWQLAEPGADAFRPRCFVRFGNLDTLAAETRGRMKAWLSEQGTPIAIVVNMMSGWVTYRGENRAVVRINECGATEERGACLNAAGESLGGQHMMTVIGYDDSYPGIEDYPGLPPEKRGSFLVVNQWGLKWGDRGYMWIPYTELEKIWVAGYGIIGRDLDQPQQDAGECVQDPITGQYAVLFEDNDVPEDLSKDGGRVVKSATLLPGGIPDGNVGRAVDVPTLRGGTVDTADWYRFTVTNARGAVITLGFDANPDLRVLVTDAEFRRIREADDESGPVAGTWKGRVCRAGTYYVKLYPPEGYVSDDQGINYTLTLTLATPPPAGNDGDEICDALEMSQGAASGDVRVDVDIATGTFTYFDRLDYWRYTVPSTGELAIALAGSADVAGISDDVALIVFEGQTAETAQPVAWTSVKLRDDYDPASATGSAVMNLGPRTAGETLYIAAVHYAWTLDAFGKELGYDFRIVAPDECPQGWDCVETPQGRYPQPLLERDKQWRLLRSWEYEDLSQPSYYTVPVDGARELRVSIKPSATGPAAAPMRELRLVAAAENFNESRLVSSRIVPADPGGELRLLVPTFPDDVPVMGTDGRFGSPTAVHVEVHDPLGDNPPAPSFPGYDVRIEEWGIGSGALQAYGPPATDAPPRDRSDAACLDTDMNVVPCPNIRYAAPIYLLAPNWDQAGKEWILGSSWLWNQPWYSSQRSNVDGLGSGDEGYLPGPVAPIARRLVLGVSDFCPEFDLQIKTLLGNGPRGLFVDPVSSTSNTVFQRLLIPAVQGDGVVMAPDPGTSGDPNDPATPIQLGRGPTHIWLGLCQRNTQPPLPLQNYSIRIWDDVTLDNWSEAWREEDDFQPSENSGPTTPEMLTLGTDGTATASGSVDFGNRYDFYSVEIPQDARVSVDLTNVCLAYNTNTGAVLDCAGPHAGVAVWNLAASAWTPTQEAQTGAEQSVSLTNVKAGTVLTIVVEKTPGSAVNGYSRAEYTLQVTTGP